jgi:hypothetical protein
MKRSGVEGFALVITLVLLALLVVALLALGTVTQIGQQSAATSVAQMTARQHALLGLGVALGELQKLAGPDDRITGMAGIAGVAPGANATTRYWTGVWTGDGQFLGWLASGADNPGSRSLELYANGAVGAASSTSANVEKEHVIAGKINVPTSLPGGAFGVAGTYAWVVLDEGVKVSAHAPVAERALAAAAPAIGASMLTNQLKLRTALQSQAAVLPSILWYEQLGLLAGVTPSVIQDCFHYVALTPRMVQGGQLVAGQINLNTSSTLVWRSLLDTYNTLPGVVPVANVTTRGNQIGNGFAATTAGKAANGPFVSVDAFAAYLETIFPATGSPTAAQVIDALRPLLTTRSDSFRLRAYGEAVNPADDTVVEAAVTCEAWVQRTPAATPGFGRRFVVTTFRWLGPDDL